MSFRIVVDDLRGHEITALLAEHLDEMRASSPPGSAHALDLESLRRPEVTFWTVWDGDDLLGGGALLELDTDHGEIKSMRTVVAHRGRGVASRLVDHIIAEARLRGYGRLSLETGSSWRFAPAMRLYERHGFEPCEPFGDYPEDRESVHMTLLLSPPDRSR